MLWLLETYTYIEAVHIVHAHTPCNTTRHRTHIHTRARTHVRTLISAFNGPCQAGSGCCPGVGRSSYFLTPSMVMQCDGLVHCNQLMTCLPLCLRGGTKLIKVQSASDITRSGAYYSYRPFSLAFFRPSSLPRTPFFELHRKTRRRSKTCSFPFIIDAYVVAFVLAQ